MSAELWGQNSSNSISPNSYDMKIVYHDQDWPVKRSDDIFALVLRYKRLEIETPYPASKVRGAQISGESR